MAMVCVLDLGCASQLQGSNRSIHAAEHVLGSALGARAAIFTEGFAGDAATVQKKLNAGGLRYRPYQDAERRTQQQIPDTKRLVACRSRD